LNFGGDLAPVQRFRPLMRLPLGYHAEMLDWMELSSLAHGPDDSRNGWEPFPFGGDKTQHGNLVIVRF
jgi:hypothetical protein